MGIFSKACRIRANRVPDTAVRTTEYAKVTGIKPSLKHVRVFGCTAYVLLVPRSSKFESRALEGVDLETLEHGLYRVLIHDEDFGVRLFESRHVTFEESRFPGAPLLAQNYGWGGAIGPRLLRVYFVCRWHLG